MGTEEIARELEREGCEVEIKEEGVLRVKRIFKHFLTVLDSWRGGNAVLPLIAIRTPFMHDASLPLEAINAFNNAVPPLIRLVRFEHNSKLLLVESATCVIESAQISAWLEMYEAILIKCVVPFLNKFELDWMKVIEEIMEESDDERNFLHRFPKN